MQVTEIKPGLTLATKHIPWVRSVSLGFWVRSGVEYEPANWQGISHFLEHMLFKGTKNRSSREISEGFDNIGGEVNAYTAKEYTCFYFKVVDEHMPVAVDILADMICNSRLDDKDIVKERNVILEEVNMYEDSPDEYVHDLLAQAIWPDHPLGRAILGTRDTLKAITPENIRDYYRKHFSAGNIIIAASGSVDHDALLDRLRAAIDLPSQPKIEPAHSPKIQPTQKLVDRATEQMHVTLGFPGLSLSDTRLYAWNLLNNILGAGMSSRLFQRLREEHALVYSAYSYTASFQMAGYSALYLGLTPQNVGKALSLIAGELRSLQREPVSAEELTRSKAQIKGALIMGLESTANHMSRMGRGLMLMERVRPMEEIVAEIEAVTQEDIQSLAQELYQRNQMAVAAVGNMQELSKILSSLSW